MLKFILTSLTCISLNAAAWGYELILDCKGCDINKITDKQELQTFVLMLVDEIGMKAYGPTIIEHFATHDPKAAGYSLVQLIETSAITGHFVDMNGDCYLNIFSCKKFDQKRALHFIEQFFKPKNVNHAFIHRSA